MDKQPAFSDPFVFDPFIKEMPGIGLMKLDIGAGEKFSRRDGSWMTVDKYSKADFQTDMWDLPMEDGTVDAIWSSHALEHVPRERVIPTLTEWHRVLKVGSPCVIQVPDLDYIARIWLQWGNEAALVGVFGGQDHEGEFHKTGWNLAGLCKDVESVGFTIKESKTFWTPDYTQYSLRVEAIK